MKKPNKTCACGHARDEHGGDPQYPGSTACSVFNCDCVAYESEDGANLRAIPKYLPPRKPRRKRHAKR